MDSKLRHYMLDCEPGRIAITGSPVGWVKEGSPGDPQGRVVISAPASGGRSECSIAPDGSFAAELSGPLEVGRKNQRKALGVLLDAFRARGSSVTVIDDGQDDRGEDGRIELDGEIAVIQIVSVPVGHLTWKELFSSGTATRRWGFQECVAMVREALIHKKGKATGTILVLDASHVGAMIGKPLIDAYRQAHGDPEIEFSLREVWLVGATCISAFRLGVSK